MIAVYNHIMYIVSSLGLKLINVPPPPPKEIDNWIQKKVKLKPNWKISFIL